MTAIATDIFDFDAKPIGAIESGSTERSRPISEMDDIDELVKTHRARLLRFVLYSTGDADLAETVAQETLLKAYNSRASFRGESSVKTWLTGIAINTIRDHLRSNRYRFWRQVRSTAIDVQEMSSFIAADGLNPEGLLLAREQLKHIARALEKLSRNQKTVFLMKFSEEMTVAEISEVLAMPVKTVRTHLHRALKSVRSQLGERS
jgi:RNA polymerase sigma-70 factor (ECF subfamily)